MNAWCTESTILEHIQHSSIGRSHLSNTKHGRPRRHIATRKAENTFVLQWQQSSKRKNDYRMFVCKRSIFARHIEASAKANVSYSFNLNSNPAFARLKFYVSLGNTCLYFRAVSWASLHFHASLVSCGIYVWTNMAGCFLQGICAHLRLWEKKSQFFSLEQNNKLIALENTPSSSRGLNERQLRRAKNWCPTKLAILFFMEEPDDLNCFQYSMTSKNT